MVDVLTAFVLIGAIIFFGYGAQKIFERTNVPDILLLIAAGFILGPVLRVVDATPFDPLLNFFASLALLVIMFAGGLHFNFYRVIKNLSRSTLFSIFAYFLTVLLTFVIAKFAFSWEFLPALFLAFIVSDTDPSIVHSLFPKLRTDEATKISISVEAVVSSTLSTVFAVTLLQYLSATAINVQTALSTLASAFSVAIVSGIAAGFIWLAILQRIREVSFSSMLTLGAAFVLYGVSSILQGNGVISVFVFGLVLGNVKRFTAVLQKPTNLEPEKEVTMFQDQIAFFVRTFFFVYVGLIISTVSATITYVTAIALLVGILVAREVSIRLVGEPNHPSVLLHKYTIPSGLAALVLALLPPKSFAPGVVEIVLLIVVLTNIVTAVAVFFHQQAYRGPVDGRPRVVARPR